MEEVPGIRKNTKFWRGPDKYDYHENKRKKDDGRISLRCRMHYLERCKGWASCDSKYKDFRQTQPHNHAPDKWIIESQAFRRGLMERCRSGDHTPFKEMYHQVRRELKISQQAAARIPPVSLRSSMRRARLENRPLIPRSLKALDKVLRQRQYRALSRTIDGKDNIYAGRSGSASRKTLSLIFVTRRMRKYLKKVKKLFCDATFCPVPRRMKASQVWTLSTLRLHHVIPLVRVLMRRRTTEAYVEVLRKIKTFSPRFNPSEIMTDFEAAEQRALATVFPNATLHGCLFHYAKAIGGRARKLGMSKIIKKSRRVRELVRMISVLPLLPPDQIMLGFAEIGRLTVKKMVALKMKRLMQYWVRTWRPKLHVLSVSGCADRTSNASESDNKTLQDAVRQKRPNVWDFMDGVLHVEDTTHQDLAVLKGFRNPKRIRPTSAVANDSRIKILTEELKNADISIKEFLRGASFSMKNALKCGLKGRKNTH